jgi:hypothetical protein
MPRQRRLPLKGGYGYCRVCGERGRTGIKGLPGTRDCRSLFIRSVIMTIMNINETKDALRPASL